MALCSGASTLLNPPVQRGWSWPLTLAVSSGLRRSRVRLAARRYRYQPARYTNGPPQVHPRSVGGQRKLARAAQLVAGLSVAGRCILQPMCRPGRRGLLPAVVSPKRYPDISRVLVSARGSRGPCAGQTLDPPVIFREPDGLFTEDSGHRNQGESSSVNRPLPPPRPERSAQMRHRAGSMIADAVRYMSVHSRKQPDSHGHSGTSQPQKQQPARRGIPSSRAVSAGGGRCWVRTSVG
jgi:hypothetical protein